MVYCSMSLYIIYRNPKLRALERYENFDGPEDVGSLCQLLLIGLGVPEFRV